MPPDTTMPDTLPHRLLQDKVAIVTGAGRGIGTAIARLFASEGARVVVHYGSSRGSAESLASEIGGIALCADLRDPDASQKLADDALAYFGRIDILINNAAGFTPGKPFENATWPDFQNEFAGVVGVTINPTHAVLPAMKRQKYGRIVNFAATLIQRPMAEMIVHTTAKSALIGFTRTLARDLGPHGITVNLISPGMTLTDYSLSLPDDVKDRVASQTPLRRLAESDDVARLALFYASPLADFITGANVAPDGGLAVL
jgi:3-oxoacyl-[acyl-carrier protein] reductase